MKKIKKVFIVTMLILSICFIMANGYNIKAKADNFGEVYYDFQVYSRNSEFTITDDGVFAQPCDRMTISDYTYAPRELSNHFMYVTIILEITIAEINDGYQHIYLYNGLETNSVLLDDLEYEHTSGALNENYVSRILYFNNIPLSLFTTNDIVIRYGASGSNEDTWLNKDVSVDLVYNTPVVQSNDVSIATDSYDYLRNSEYTITDDEMIQPYDRITTSDYINAPLSMVNTYNYVNITIEIQIKEINDGYQHIILCNSIENNGTILAERQIEHSPGSAGTSYSTYTIEFKSVPISLFTTNDIVIKYGASGSEHDNWKNRNVRVMLVYSNSNSELGVNFKYGEILNASQTKSYTCYIPNDLYYIAESIGEQSATITITGIGGLTVTSLSNISGTTARNEFYCSGSGYIMLQVHNNTSVVATIEFQVRRQQAVFYGYDYELTDLDDLNTTNVAQYGYAEFNDLYYSQKYLYNNMHNVEHLLGNDARGYSRLNSEIVLISGHGDETHIQLPKNGIIGQNEFGDMSCVKLAIFNTCCSAAQSTATSVVESAINRGATTVVGWTESLISASSDEFCERFFMYLRMGYSVNDSFEFVQRDLIYNDMNLDAICTSIRIAGNGSLTLAHSNSRQKSSMLNIASNNELGQYKARLSSSNDWYEIEYNENETRIYHTINGYLTTDYYTLSKQNGNVVQAKHSGIFADEMTILPINIRSNTVVDSISIANQKFILSQSNSTIRYINFGTKLVPVQTVFCTYTDVGGYTYKTVYCTNLNDGSKINYADICFIRR